MPHSASSRLLGRSDDIMRRWEDRANKEVLAALQLESLALRNSLPELLSLIAQLLSTTSSHSEARDKWERDEGTRVGKKHGRERADSQEYTISQMIFEYHILRQVICDTMEEDALLTPVEREVIVCAIEQAVNDASTQFSNTLAEAQEHLAAALTHDLKGPLTVAKLATQRILRRPREAEYCTQAATRIASSVERLELMIQSLLDVSLIKAGRQLTMRIDEFAISQLAQQLTEDFNIVYDSRLVFSSSVVGNVYWDKADICRIIENLTSNAAKYGTEGTPITVMLSQQDDDVTISVHNQGAIIPPKEHDSLFGQFGRGKSPQQQKGWGIGLTVVKGIVDAHHGKIRIDSTTPLGTTFVVQLPRDARV